MSQKERTNEEIAKELEDLKIRYDKELKSIKKGICNLVGCKTFLDDMTKSLSTTYNNYNILVHDKSYSESVILGMMLKEIEFTVRRMNDVISGRLEIPVKISPDEIINIMKDKINSEMVTTTDKNNMYA